MKYTFLSLVSLLTLTTVSYAQKIGLKAGGNFSNVMGSNDGSASGTTDKRTFVPGFHVGAFGEMDVAEIVSLQLEAVYSTKGYNQKSTTSSVISSTELKAKYTLSYVDVPLLVNIHFGQMGSYVGFGPQLSFLTGVKWDGDMTTTFSSSAPPPLTNTSTTMDFSGKDTSGYYSKTDFGIVLGTGAKWDSGIEYCIRAGYGLTNVVNPATSKSDAVWHNLVFSISIGYGFDVGGGGGGGDRYGHKYKKKKR